MKSLHLNPGNCVPIQGKILERKRAYLIIVCLEPEGLLRTVLEFLLQDGESFAEQFKQKLKLSRQLYKQPFVYTTTWDRQTLLLTVQLASLTASMIQEIFCQESDAESLQLMKIPVLFATYLLREEPDIAIMLWMSGRLWKPMLIQSKVPIPGNWITFVNEVPSMNPRFTEDIISDLYPHVNLLVAFNVCDKPFSF